MWIVCLSVCPPVCLACLLCGLLSGLFAVWPIWYLTAWLSDWLDVWNSVKHYTCLWKPTFYKQFNKSQNHCFLGHDLNSQLSENLSQYSCILYVLVCLLQRDAMLDLKSWPFKISMYICSALSLFYIQLIYDNSQSFSKEIPWNCMNFIHEWLLSRADISHLSAETFLKSPPKVCKIKV